MKDFSEADLAKVENAGRVGFSYKELAIMLDVEEADMRDEFEEAHGNVYQAWMKGRLQTELDLRQSLLKEAKAGSVPCMNKISQILSATDEEHNKLYY